ncbi:DNRLRE domain-containing protein [Pseudobacillus badius]|uniref:DNRLRE domain-containing protein n=1 Tax=Bacillus badius TaxID=1455 RepID=UPI003D349768
MKRNSRKEIVERRTELSKTFLNPTGTYTTEFFPEPVHVRTPRGAWEEIDSRFKENKKTNRFEHQGAAFKTVLPVAIQEDGPTLSIEEGNRAIRMQMELPQEKGENFVLSEGQTEENTLIYPDVMTGASLEYKVDSDRIKENIIFKEFPTEGFPTQFTYRVVLEGLQPKDENGTLYLIDPKTGEKVYYFMNPLMYDAYQPEGYVKAEGFEAIPEEALSYEIELKHKMDGEDLLVILVPDQKWLNNEARVFPITIDPTIVRLQSKPYVADTNIRSAFPTQTGGADLELGAGTSGGNVIRTLLRFDLSSIPKTSVILGSSLNLFFSSTNNSSPLNVSIYKLTRDWLENQASWTYAKTSPSTAWTNKGGDYVTSNKLDSVTLTSPDPSMDNNMVRWNIPVHILQEWLTNPSVNFGVILKSDTELTNIYKKFTSSDMSIAAKYKPLLSVTYQTNARLGVEDYWDYDVHNLVGGAAMVNLTTGNLITQYRDISVLGRGGFSFLLERTYNSKSLERSGFGYGWTHSGNEKLFVNVSETMDAIHYQDSDGTVIKYTYDRSIYRPTAGRYETIKQSSTDTYTMTLKNGAQKIFRVLENPIDTVVKVAYIIKEKDLHGNQIIYDYNSDNQLSAVYTDLGLSLSKLLTFTYNAQGYIDTASYDGHMFTYHYDNNGYLTSVDELKSGLSNKTTTQFIYTNGVLETIIDPNGRKTTFTYMNGNIIKLQEPDINSTTDSVNRPGTLYGFNTAARTAFMTDAEGNTTNYVSNESYVIINETDAAGIMTEYKLDTNFNLLSKRQTEKLGEGAIQTRVIESNQYDSKGNLIQTQDGEGNIHIYQYDSYGNKTYHKSPNGAESTYTYNTMGDLVQSVEPTTDGTKLTTTYIYDSYGDLISRSTSDNVSDTFSMDYASGVKTTSHKDVHGNVTQTTENLSGNILSQTDGKNQKTTFQYDLKNELTSVLDAKGKKTQYVYDDNGNLTSITDANGHSKTFEYNGQNQLNKETDAIGHTKAYTYDANGNLESVKRADGSTLQYQYDEDNRMISILSGSTVLWRLDHSLIETKVYQGEALDKTYEYYDNDLLKSIDFHNGNGLISFSYSGDSFLSQISHIGFNGKWDTFEFVPDDAQHTKEIKRNNILLASLGYTTAGLPETTIFGNGSSLARTYQNRRLASETLKKSDSTVFQKFTYDYDGNNNITSIQTATGTISFTYDELNQLVKETYPDGLMITYAYDEAGNRTLKSVTQNGNTIQTVFQFNEANQLTSVGSKAYQHDVNGNLVSDGDRTYVYNALDQLTQVKNNSGSTIVTFTYDENGNRDSRKDANGTTFFYYAENKLLFETDQNQNVTKEYLYDDEDHLVAMVYEGNVYYYLTNYRGDVLGLVDASGNLVAEYKYDAWGNILSMSGDMASINPYRYASYYFDDQIQLYYLKSRYYNPSTGTFHSKDPIKGDLANPISLNGYNYADNNPVMNIDPNGQFSFPKVLKRIIRNLIKAIFNDFRENTLTNIFFFVAGGGVGVWGARRVLPRLRYYIPSRYKRYNKDILAFITGGVGAYVTGGLGGNLGGKINTFLSWVNKAWSYEKWFDRTRAGKWVDRQLTKAERYLLKKIR